MAWRLKKVEEQRKELVENYIKGNYSIVELSKKFGISRKTGHKWVNRWLKEGEEGLKDLSRVPHNPNKIFSDEIINMAIDLKLKKPTWGPRKILERLKRDYPNVDWPSGTRLHGIFKEEHLVTPRRIRHRVPATHPLGGVNESNDVWTVDFKGWFLTQNGEKCEPITLQDAFSRFCFNCEHLERKTSQHVWPIFKESFEEYGLPNRVRSDNGPPFGSTGAGRLTLLSVNLIKAGVMPEWINPGHPEENGRHERFHLTLQQAVATPPAETLSEQMKKIRAFQREYNFERPHEALGMEVPAHYYKKSKRKWDGILRSPEYDTQLMQVRKVGQNGCIWIKHTPCYLAEVLQGEHVGLQETENGELKVYYGAVCLGKITADFTLERPKLQPKRVVRRG